MKKKIQKKINLPFPQSEMTDLWNKVILASVYDSTKYGNGFEV